MLFSSLYETSLIPLNVHTVLRKELASEDAALFSQHCSGLQVSQHRERVVVVSMGREGGEMGRERVDPSRIAMYQVPNSIYFPFPSLVPVSVK